MVSSFLTCFLSVDIDKNNGMPYNEMYIMIGIFSADINTDLEE